jgi:hypothetical protein
LPGVIAPQPADATTRPSVAVRVFTSFADLPAEVRQALSHPAQPNFFVSLDWFEVLFETSLQATVEPRIYVLFDDARQQVQCALFCGRDKVRPGRALVSLGNFYTQEYLPSFPRESVGRRDAIAQLVRFIAAERPRWDTLRLGLVKTDAPEFAWLLEALRDQGFGTETFFQYDNWHLPVAAGTSFAGYFAERPSQLRNTITRRQKKLEKAHKFEIRLARGQDSDFAVLARDFVAIYEASWKNPEPFPEFIPSLVARCAALGILRLGVLYVDGQPAASQLWVTAGGKTLIYKLAYDERYAEFGVGSILSRELFRVAIDEDRVGEIDYGVGSEPYKRDWMLAARRLEGIEAHNRRSLRGLAQLSLAGARRLAKRARALVKRS